MNHSLSNLLELAFGETVAACDEHPLIDLQRTGYEKVGHRLHRDGGQQQTAEAVRRLRDTLNGIRDCQSPVPPDDLRHIDFAPLITGQRDITQKILLVEICRRSERINGNLGVLLDWLDGSL